MRVGLVALWFVAASCGYRGSARDVELAEVRAKPGWLLVPGVPFIRGDGAEEAGAAALSMVLSYWQTPTATRDVFASLPNVEDSGLDAKNLRDFAEARGVTAFLFEGDMTVLEHELLVGRPVIVGVIKEHAFSAVGSYEVVVGLHFERRLVITLDPSRGYRENTVQGFLAEWQRSRNLTLVLMPNR